MNTQENTRRRLWDVSHERYEMRVQIEKMLEKPRRELIAGFEELEGELVKVDLCSNAKVPEPLISSHSASFEGVVKGIEFQKDSNKVVAFFKEVQFLYSDFFCDGYTFHVDLDFIEKVERLDPVEGRLDTHYFQRGSIYD
jgi:hypothetical protein